MNRDTANRCTHNGRSTASAGPWDNTMKRILFAGTSLVALCHAAIASLISHLWGGPGREHPLVSGCVPPRVHALTALAGEVWAYLLDVSVKVRVASEPRLLSSLIGRGKTDA
jgi:hypothetical protein